MKNTTNQMYTNTSTWWGFITSFLLSTNNRLYIGWFGVLMFPLIAVATVAYIAAFTLVAIHLCRHRSLATCHFSKVHWSGSLRSSNSSIHSRIHSSTSSRHRWNQRTSSRKPTLRKQHNNRSSYTKFKCNRSSLLSSMGST
jgi:photosystem II P680 reaction center D1 protein